MSKSDYPLAKYIPQFSTIHVISFKEASGSLSFQRALLKMYRIYKKILQSYQGVQNFGEKWYDLEEILRLPEDEGDITCMFHYLPEISTSKLEFNVLFLFDL